MTAGDRETDVLGAAEALEAAAACAATDWLAPGATAGNWRITAPIAAGGCGVVYEARHAVLGRPAAIKVLHAALASAPVMVERFVREARAVNAIGHPNIVDIFDIGTLADGRPFLVMELLARGDLEQRIAAAGRLTPVEALAILAPVCDALEAAHRAGYIHRDLKARNIGFAVTAGGADIPKLLDFGIAKLLEAGREDGTATLGVGTPHCMSPEQIRGERVDARTDVYALGVLLYHLLTGRCPFDADDAATLERLHLETPPPVPSRLAPLSPALDALVARALAKDPAARPASPRALIDQLLDATDPAVAALAIHVELALPDAFDDRDLDAAAAAAELAAALLDERGFAPILVTATAVHATRPIGSDPASAAAAARATVVAVERALATRPDLRAAARVTLDGAPDVQDATR